MRPAIFRRGRRTGERPFRLSGCGGGPGDQSHPSTFSIGGTVTGLNGSGTLILQNNDGYEAGKTNLIESATNVSGTMNSFYEGQVRSADYLQDMEDGNCDGLR